MHLQAKCFPSNARRIWKFWPALTILLFVGILQFLPRSRILRPTSSSGVPLRIPRKIWQSWSHPVQDLHDEEFQRFVKTWTDLNPEHRYELLTDHTAVSYVSDQFRDAPEIVDTFRRIDDRILRADFFRYLVILNEGGVYADIDAECSRPIDTWIPLEMVNSTGHVIGIEYDARGEPGSHGFEHPISLCQWTFMARPRHPVLQHVVDNVAARLQAQARESEAERIVAGVGGDVGELTGPAAT